MALADKANWLIESNLAGELTLAGLADRLGVSPHHLARSFVTSTGQPVMRHVWQRRLTLAAIALAQGEGSILTVALDAGYGGPEAFARAFRAEFGIPPSALRRSRRLDDLTLTQPLHMRPPMTALFTAPTLTKMPQRSYAGLSRRYDMQSRSAIPAQWTEYNIAGERAPSPSPKDYFGIVYNFTEDGTFDYLCGQECSPGASLPQRFSRTLLPAATYARFATLAHISTMQAAWAEIWGDWLTRPEYRPQQGPSVEYYPPAFSGETGEGGYEIWIPVAD